MAKDVKSCTHLNDDGTFARERIGLKWEDWSACTVCGEDLVKKIKNEDDTIGFLLK